MAGPVLDEADEVLGLTQGSEDRLGHLQVGPLVLRPDVVDLSSPAPTPHEVNGLAVVLHVNPVPYVTSVAVEGQGFRLEGTGDMERDELLRELIRTKIVGGARDLHLEPVRPMVG